MPYSVGAITTHERIRLANPDLGKETEFSAAAEKVIITTVGRVLFSEVWPPELGFCNKSVKKSDLGDMIRPCYKACGHEKTVIMLDKLKELGFREATRAGVSIGIDDLIVPEERSARIETARAKVLKVKVRHERKHHKVRLMQRPDYMITFMTGEHHRDDVMMCPPCRRKIERIWTKCTKLVSNAMMKPLEANQGKGEYNPVWLMLKSRARGNEEQVRQLIGLRGLMAKPGGGIIEKPVLSNFREGLTVLEYFISSHGARKGVDDKSRQTGDAGFLTRKLVDAAQDVVIREEDCGTVDRIWVQALDEGGKQIVTLADRIVGRVACGDIPNPLDVNKTIVCANQEINEDLTRAIDQAAIKTVKVRSVITCESKHGVCAKCYGRHLPTGTLVKVGEPVGIIAAQSIGEPGTQLTMRTFHTGGTASQRDITRGLPSITELLEARPPIISGMEGIVNSIVNVGQGWHVVIKDLKTGVQEGQSIPAGRTLVVREGDPVTKGQPLTKGLIDLHEFLRTHDLQEFQEQLVNEVQKVYCPQDVTINDKHIEVIVRQMLRKISITEPGDTTFSIGALIDKLDFQEENRRLEKLGGQPSEAILTSIVRCA